MQVMMESREMSRLYLQSARNVVGVVADHAVKSLNLSIASTLSSFEYALQLARAKSGREVMELSAAHYLNQLNVMRCSHDCHLDFHLQDRDGCSAAVQAAYSCIDLRHFVKKNAETA